MLFSAEKEVRIHIQNAKTYVKLIFYFNQIFRIFGVCNEIYCELKAHNINFQRKIHIQIFEKNVFVRKLVMESSSISLDTKLTWFAYFFHFVSFSKSLDAMILTSFLLKLQFLIIRKKKTKRDRQILIRDDRQILIREKMFHLRSLNENSVVHKECLCWNYK